MAEIKTQTWRRCNVERRCHECRCAIQRRAWNHEENEFLLGAWHRTYRCVECAAAVTGVTVDAVNAELRRLEAVSTARQRQASLAREQRKRTLVHLGEGI